MYKIFMLLTAMHYIQYNTDCGVVFRFRRFVEAATPPPPPQKHRESLAPCDSPASSPGTLAGGMAPLFPASAVGDSSGDTVRPQASEEEGAPSFSTYMAELLYPSGAVGAEVAWLNAVAGRLMFDFLHDPYWANKVSLWGGWMICHFSNI